MTGYTQTISQTSIGMSRLRFAYRIGGYYPMRTQADKKIVTLRSLRRVSQVVCID